MLLIVFSDAHGNTENMRRAVERYHPDYAVFLGDGLRDAQTVAAEFPQIPFRLLRGNCDWNASGAEESALFTLDGLRIFAAHGHRHGVKMNLDSFVNSVCCAGAQLGLYGHTHRALYREIAGVQILNPGSVGDYASPSCALVQIENGTAQCQIIPL